MITDVLVMEMLCTVEVYQIYVFTLGFCSCLNSEDVLLQIFDHRDN